MKFVAGFLILASFAAPVRAAGGQVLLTWRPLGLGTTYCVQTSTNLLTWTNTATTTATNATLNLNGVGTCMFRLSASNAPPQSASLAWNPCSHATNVVGYNIYYGGATRNYTNKTNIGLATNCVMSGLQAGATYYVATTGYTASGMESNYSNEIVWKCPLLLSIQPLP